MGAALHLRIPPALKTGPRLTALLPTLLLTYNPLGQRTPRLTTGPKEAERQHQLVANRASIAVNLVPVGDGARKGDYYWLRPKPEE